MKFFIAVVITLLMPTLCAQSLQALTKGKPRPLTEQLEVLKELAGVDLTAEQTASILQMKNDAPSIRTYMLAVVDDHLRALESLPVNGQDAFGAFDRHHDTVLLQNAKKFIKKWTPAVPLEKVVDFRKAVWAQLERESTH